jgi:hypothetical protein
MKWQKTLRHLFGASQSDYTNRDNADLKAIIKMLEETFRSHLGISNEIARGGYAN